MKCFHIISLGFVALLALTGCASNLPLKQTVGFTAGSVDARPSPTHLGVVLADGFETYSVRKINLVLPIGEVIAKNIGSSLSNCFQTVTASTSASALPATVDNVAYVRFAPGNSFTGFKELKMTIVLSFQLFDKTGKELKWETTARGEKVTVLGTSANIFNIQMIHRNLVDDAIQACLTDLNGQISTKGKKALGIH